MTRLIALLVFVAGALIAQTSDTRRVTRQVKSGGHLVAVTSGTGPFVPGRHKIGARKAPESYPPSDCPTVDGRDALGTDCGLPRTEITSFDLTFDGEKVPVGPELYRDCFDFGRGDLEMRVGDDGASVFIFGSGSDAAGSYQVIWVLRKDGRHSRFSGSCSDCGFIDFESGFFREYQQ